MTVADQDKDPSKSVIGPAGSDNDPPSTGTGETSRAGEIELTIVTMVFDAADPATLLSVLSKYVVVARMEEGCRNIDLCASVTAPGRYAIIEKWDSPTVQRAHFDGEAMVEMARSCAGLLSGPPSIDLLEGISAHDLR